MARVEYFSDPDMLHVSQVLRAQGAGLGPKRMRMDVEG